jgi:phosphatidylserine/phosphatidylglycerophosphate/cardiolipin synthase-like enzyme
MLPRGLAVLALLALTSCGTAPAELADGPDDVALPGGKADSPYSDCQLTRVLTYVNDPATTYEVMRAAAVPSTAARNIVAHRDGPDGLAGTADDDRFDDLAELDAVKYVGPVTLSRLVAAAEGPCAAATSIDVIFSPQPYDQSHLARIAELIDGAQRSLDLALYSFSDAKISDALKRAVARGVSVRLIYDTASEDRKSPAGTASARLEDLGVDVRWVNKIMHHKFAIVDGARDGLEEAADATVVTGSANWSYSAGTRYDENTVFIRHSPELALRFQREFNYLWDNSREFLWNQDLQFFSSAPVDDTTLPDDPALDAVFTSANFRVAETSYGPTFTIVRGRNTVVDRLVALIRSATKSIHLASGHLRSRAVAEALMSKHVESPEVEIRIYLDGQEYISESYNRSQESNLAACLAAAGDNTTKQADCVDNNFYFSYVVQSAGIPLRFKYYAYRWDFTYAVQMHHKYLVVDDRVLAAGSYNLSDNAEHATMENMVFYSGPAYQDLIDAFEGNFNAIWETGRAGDAYQALVQRIESGPGDIPLVFDSLALDHDEVTELKRLIRQYCPIVDSDAYRSDPANHRTCPR